MQREARGEEQYEQRILKVGILRRPHPFAILVTQS